MMTQTESTLPRTTSTQSSDESLFCLIMDLVTALYPRSSDHHTARSEAIVRLRRARRDGWEGFNATLAATRALPDAIGAFSGGVIAAEQPKPPTKPLTADARVVTGYEGGPEGYEGNSISGSPLPGQRTIRCRRYGDFIPYVRIPDRY